MKLFVRFLFLSLGILIGVGATLAYSSSQAACKKNLSADEKNLFLELVSTVDALKKDKNINFSSLMWQIYPHVVKMGLHPSTLPKDSEFQQKGYKQGLITKDKVDLFKASLAEADTKEISYEDHNPGYVINEYLRPYEKDLNSSHKLYLLKEKQLEALAPILEELKDPIAACLGSPWTIINVLCWETGPEAIETGPNDWHTDGMPHSVNKVMVYLTGASMERGTTQMKFKDGTFHHAEGPEGTWLLFKVNEIVHRGIKPKTGTRIALEIRAIPTFEFDLSPVCAGFNSLYPKCPWHLGLLQQNQEIVQKDAPQ